MYQTLVSKATYQINENKLSKNKQRATGQPKQSPVQKSAMLTGTFGKLHQVHKGPKKNSYSCAIMWYTCIWHFTTTQGQTWWSESCLLPIYHLRSISNMGIFLRSAAYIRIQVSVTLTLTCQCPSMLNVTRRLDSLVYEFLFIFTQEVCSITSVP